MCLEEFLGKMDALHQASLFHSLLEFVLTLVHWVGDAIQPSHPLLALSPPALNLSQHQGLSHELAFCIRWPRYWSFSISPSNEYSGFIFFKTDGLISLLSKGLARVFSNTTVRKHLFFGTQQIKSRLWFFSFILYWSIVDLHYCISFRYTAEWFSYIYIPISILFQILFSFSLL